MNFVFILFIEIAANLYAMNGKYNVVILTEWTKMVNSCAVHDNDVIPLNTRPNFE